MFDFFERLRYSFGFGKPRLSLEMQQGRVELVGSGGANVRHWLSSTARFRRRCRQGVKGLVIPFNALPQVRQALLDNANPSLDIAISPEVANLRLIKAPEGFSVFYEWASEEQAMLPRSSMDARYSGDGWFVAGDYCWQVPNIKEQDDAWLGLPLIAGEKLLAFLQTVFPAWEKRKLPFATNLTYSAEPAATLRVKEVAEDAVTIAVQWQEPVELIEPVASLPGHVMARHTIRPGVAPAHFSPQPRVGDSFRLEGEEIPYFVRDIWPHVRGITSGLTEELVQKHPVLEEAELVLEIERREQNGIGSAVGVSIFSCAGMRLDALAVCQALEKGHEFLWLDGRWLSLAAVRRAVAGSDRSYLTKWKLKPANLLLRNLLGRDGPWQKVQFPPLSLPQGSSPLETARLHLTFLRSWGLPGGVTGAPELAPAFREELLAFLNDYPQGRVLVVGASNYLDAFSGKQKIGPWRRFNGGKRDPAFTPPAQGMALATPRALAAFKGDLGRWDVLCLLDADNLVKSPNSQLARRLFTCRSRLALGLFSGRDFHKRPPALRALSSILGTGSGVDSEAIWQYALRDPHRKAQLPPAERWQPPATGRPQASEIYLRSLGTSPFGQAIPLPLRESLSGFNVGIFRPRPVTSPAEEFVARAKEMAGRREEKTKQPSSPLYWPGYSHMTPAQEKWYLYWRDQVRQGNYLPTDSAYILTHAYELLNRVGVASVADGYEQLRRLWRHYREKYSALDDEMPDWLADYAALYGYPTDPLEPYREAAEIGTRLQDADLAVTACLHLPLERMPLAILELVSGYKIRRSRFYAGNETLVQEAVPAALAKVSAFLQEATGKDLLAAIRPPRPRIAIRLPFRNALYSGPERKVNLGRVYSYCRYPPAQELLSAILKHTENKLREKEKVRGRLKTGPFPPEIAAVIDEFITGGPRPQTARQQITIDLSLVQALARESDEVRDILLQNAEEEPLPDQPTPEPQEARPIAVPAPTSGGETASGNGLPPEWQEFLSCLDCVSLAALKVIAQENRAALEEIAASNATMPTLLVDALNQAAIDCVGDIVIDVDAAALAIVEDYREVMQDILVVLG